MRTIFLLRGSPAAGKSSWVKNNNLEQYTLSADAIRLLYQSPVLNKEGEFTISQDNDYKVWELLFNLLEDKMSRGEFIIVDATHYKQSLLNKYKELISKYRYRAYVVDFTDVPKEELLRRNSNRDKYKKVPEAAISKMCAVFEQDTEVSKKFKILSREEALNLLNSSLLLSYDETYDKIVVFGDIHGCYSPLAKYFEENPVNERTKYIFVGDYLDRGIQNKEMIEFLLKYKDEQNFLFLEGNHEKWLRYYSEDIGAESSLDKEEAKVLKKYVSKTFFYELNKNKIRSSVFLKETLPQIQEFDKGDLRQICRKFAQMAYFKFNNKEYFITHGGVPVLPNLFIPTDLMIKGVGKYEEVEDIYTTWGKLPKSCVLVHGHRNIFDVPAKTRENCYNLCSSIEAGGALRVLEITRAGEEVKLIPNTVFNEKLTRIPEKLNNMTSKTNNNFLQDLNSNKNVQKKLLPGGIISYNFTRKAFYKGIWDRITCRARGLFVDAKTEKVIARSYDKFFNWGQVPETESAELKKTLTFPVVAYKKENGFLAMASYNWNTDNLLVCSKSTNQGDFVEMIKEELEKLPEEKLEAIKDYTKDNNVTLVLECINKDKDPHIIKYEENKLVLLDIIYNDFEYKKVPYSNMCKEAERLGLIHKSLEVTFNTWDDLYAFKKQQDVSYDDRIEGWVFEDSNGFMVKYKTRFYKFWKQMRTVKEKLQQGNNVKKIYSTEDEVRVFNLLKSKTREELLSKSIIDIEEEYYAKEI